MQEGHGEARTGRTRQLSEEEFVKTSRSTRHLSEQALENETQEFVDSVDRRLKLKKKTRPGNKLIRKRTLRQARWQLFLASRHKVRFAQTPSFCPPCLGGEQEAPKSSEGGSDDGGNGAAGHGNTGDAGEGDRAGAFGDTGSVEATEITTPKVAQQNVTTRLCGRADAPCLNVVRDGRG